MQLKIRRSQREGGIVSKNVIFCLDVRVDFSPEEAACIQRYKLGREPLYNSEAQKQLLDRRDAAMASGSTSGYLKSMALTALAATKLYVTVNSLQQGQHIECKSLDELLGAEEAIMTACDNLRNYLDAASTFDGTEVVVDFSPKGPELVAVARPQQQQVLAAQPVAAAPAAQPAAITAAPAPAPQAAALAAAPAPLMQEAVIPDQPIPAPAEAPILDAPTPGNQASAPAVVYEPIVAGGFFSEGEEGERQKKVLLTVGGAIVAVLFLTALL